MRSSYHPDDELTNDPPAAKWSDPVKGESGEDDRGPFTWCECEYCPSIYKHRPWMRKPLCGDCAR